MTQIASGLSSHAASVCKPSNPKLAASQRNFMLQSSQLLSQAVMSPQNAAGLECDEPAILDDGRESVKTQASKLTNTRREIKKLIKIQNKHGKLLQQLQKSGVVLPSANPDT